LWLLVAPFVALLWPAFYSSLEPTLGGIPFFFWYQLMWVFLTAILSWVAYLLVRAARRPGRQAVDGEGR